MRNWVSGVILALGMVPGTALAEACAPDSVCAANPAGVASALQAAGYKAKLNDADATKAPTIESSAAGYTYNIYFEDCVKAVSCSSLMFLITFEKDGANSAELANEWNKVKRFSTMSYNPEKGTLTINWDVTTVGGLTSANFEDVVETWDGVLSGTKAFFDAHPAE